MFFLLKNIQDMIWLHPVTKFVFNRYTYLLMAITCIIGIEETGYHCPLWFMTYVYGSGNNAYSVPF